MEIENRFDISSETLVQCVKGAYPFMIAWETNQSQGIPEPIKWRNIALTMSIDTAYLFVNILLQKNPSAIDTHTEFIRPTDLCVTFIATRSNLVEAKVQHYHDPVVGSLLSCPKNTAKEELVDLQTTLAQRLENIS
jgi:hypothetical protein